jgi:hypothetical protein
MLGATNENVHSSRRLVIFQECCQSLSLIPVLLLRKTLALLDSLFSTETLDDYTRTTAVVHSLIGQKQRIALKKTNGQDDVIQRRQKGKAELTQLTQHRANEIARVIMSHEQHNNSKSGPKSATTDRHMGAEPPIGCSRIARSVIGSAATTIGFAVLSCREVLLGL